MEVVHSPDVPWTVYEHPREGTVELKALATGEAAAGMNFFFIMVRYGLDGDVFTTPRHRHTFEQIRFALNGSINFAKGKDIPEGCVGYFPANAYYGPQRVESGTLLGVQFGVGYLNEEEKMRAQRELAEVGEFRDGTYSYVDAASGRLRRKDGMTAMWEHIHAEPLEHRPPRYQEPVIMDPAAFGWVTETPDGIGRKHLGTFGEHRLSIDLLRCSGEGAVRLAGGRSQLLYVLGGAVALDGRTGVEGTAAWCTADEDVVVNGSEGAELMVWDLPGSA